MSKKPIKVGDQKKPWNRKVQTTSRIRGNRKIANFFEIYCEGANTEPDYFRAFPVNPATRVIAQGFGRQRIALVKHAISEWNKQGFLSGQKNYSKNRQLWVVFDFDWRGDENEHKQYTDAINLAAANEVKTAYSNDAFELWILYHFQPLVALTHRSVLCAMLDKHLGINYLREGKARAFSRELYTILESNQLTAIQNAKRQFDNQQSLGLSDQNPVTTVFKLVEELNRFKRK